MEDAHISPVTIIEQPKRQIQHMHMVANEDRFNGEEIVFEGMCDVETLKKEIKQVYCNAGLQAAATGVGILPLFIYYTACSGPLGCLCAKRVSNSWRLVLTRSRIYYTRKHHCCLCRSANTDVYVDLDDINAISVKVNEVETGCCSTANLPTTVAIDLKVGCRHDLLPHWCNQSLLEICILKCCSSPEERFVKLSFTHCANAEEFVQAVKQQMGSTKKQ